MFISRLTLFHPVPPAILEWPVIDFTDLIDSVILLPYTGAGSALLAKKYHLVLIILSEDFNVNFAIKDTQRLVASFKDKFDLDMNFDSSISTTQHEVSAKA